MNEKIKIAFFNDTMGPYHYARLDAANLKSECIFLEFSSVDHTNYWDISNELKDNKITLFTDKPITKKNKSEIFTRMDKLLTKICPDVVLISGWDATASLLSLRWCLNNNIPAILLSESQKHDFKRSFFKETIKRFLLRLFDSAFVGGINQIRYLTELGFSEKKIFPGCDLVDNYYFSVNSQVNQHLKSKYQSKYNLPEKFFFTSCRFVEKKNLKFLLKTFKKFIENNNEWSLVIAGDGPLREDLESFLDEHDLNDRVFLPGYIQYDEIPIFYGLSSCFILPSITEQWGLVINESLASGKPVLVSDKCGCAPNLVQNQEVGFIFNPMDEDDLLSKMNLITEENTYKLFCNNTKNVMTKFDKNHYSKNLNMSAKKAKLSYKRYKNPISLIILNLLIFFSK